LTNAAPLVKPSLILWPELALIGIITAQPFVASPIQELEMAGSDAPYVGLDVGGTTMKAGVVTNLGKVQSVVSLPTEPEKGQEVGLQQMCQAIRAAVDAARLRMQQIAAIGVATPGTMDLPAGIMLDPPNLKPWQNVPVRDYIHQQFGLPTAFQNDANAAAYGEYWVGAGKNMRSMVLFTLGTGVGGGIIIDDRILEGEHSHGAELGHMKIEITNPRPCGCGKRGCLEAYASATAVVQRTVEAMKAGHNSLLVESMRKQKRLTARDVFVAAAQGDTLGKEIVEQTAFYLGFAAANLMHCIDPDVIVFGGGMIAAGESFLDRIRFHAKELAFPVPAAKTIIRYASLGTDAGFIGAAACARSLLRDSK
jgi:glucokinase